VRRYAARVLAFIVCQSVRPSQVGTVPKRLNEGLSYIIITLPDTIITEINSRIHAFSWTCKIEAAKNAP